MKYQFTYILNTFTDKDKWVTAFSQVPGQESVPVQIRMDHKPTSLTKPQYTEIYSIMEFKTNDLVNRAVYAVSLSIKLGF